jgi:hypothetical protein
MPSLKTRIAYMEQQAKAGPGRGQRIADPTATTVAGLRQTMIEILEVLRANGLIER